MADIKIPTDEAILRQYSDMMQRAEMQRDAAKVYQQYLDLPLETTMALGWPKPPTPPPPPQFQGSIGGLAAGMSAAEMYSSSKLCEMLAMRMRWVRGIALPMAFLEAHLSDKIVYVFMVHNGQPAVLEDEWGLYPSDALITKMRLLLG